LGSWVSIYEIYGCQSAALQIFALTVEHEGLAKPKHFRYFYTGVSYNFKATNTFDVNISHLK